MPAKRYKVTLEPDERRDLEKLISRGKGAARRLAHARILLHADQGEGRPGKIDAEIAEAVGVSVATIERVRQRFVEEGLETALRTDAGISDTFGSSTLETFRPVHSSKLHHLFSRLS